MLRLERFGSSLAHLLAAALPTVGLTAVLACLAAPGAHADFYTQYSSGSDFRSGFAEMPDIDQRWEALLNDGRMYCVPTANYSLLAYLAQHGYPAILPGAQPLGYWHGPGSTAQILDDLSLMGVLMDTDPVDGTGGYGAKFGLGAWLGLTGSNGLFTIHSSWFGADITPNFYSIADWVNAGVPVLMVVGWYQDDGVVIVRTGGHWLTITEVEYEPSSGKRILTFHDPADDGDLLTQSAVEPVRKSVQTRARLLDGAFVNIDVMPSYSESGYIDALKAIRPIFGVMTTPDGLNILRVQPIGIDLDPNPVVDSIASPLGLQVADLVISPDSPSTYVITRPDGRTEPSRLWRFDHVTREYSDLASFDDAQAVETDRFGRLYVLDGRTLRCLQRDPEGRWIETASVIPPVPCDGLAIDDFNDQIMLLCDGSVLPFALRTLDALPEVRIPADLPIGADPFLAVSAEDGAIHLTDSLAPAVYRLDGAGGYVEIGKGILSRPRNLTVGDGRCVYVVDGATEQMKVFCPDPTSGDWVERTDLPFSGVDAGVGMKISRSTTNFDPSVHTGPGYRNVLPPETVTAVGEDLAPGAIPSRLTIASVVPNPFNPRTTIAMDLPRATDASLTVHDLRGRLVRTLHSGTLPAGRHPFVWEGTDADDRPVASGVYLVRLSTADGEQRMTKIVLAK